MENEIDLEDNFAHALQAFLTGRIGASAPGCPHPGLLSARNAGKLAGDEADHVDEHLRSCAPCRNRRQALASFAFVPLPQFVDELDDVRLVPLARAVAERAAAPHDDAKPGPPAVRLRPAIAGAFAVVAMLFAALRLSSAISPLLVQDDAWTRPVRRAVRQPAPLAEEPPPGAPSERPRKLPVPLDIHAAQSGATPALAAHGASREMRAVRRSREVANTTDERMARTHVPASIAADASETDSPTGVVAIARSNVDVVWRLGASQILRSEDRGITWRPQQGPGGSVLLVASAPTDRVCWAAGKGGAVVRTVDGRSWQTVAAPTTDDIVQVSAWSAVSATIRSSRGQRFSTVDGGATWSRL